MEKFYVLDGEGEPLPIERKDILVWGRWMEDHPTDRIVAQDTVGGADVSTVFLGINHNFFGDGPPILWETMIFGGPHDGKQWRYASRKEAVNGHIMAIALVLGATIEDL